MLQFSLSTGKEKSKQGCIQLLAKYTTKLKKTNTILVVVYHPCIHQLHVLRKVLIVTECNIVINSKKIVTLDNLT